MTITDFIRNFPEIKEKNDKYYLFLGIISGLNSSEVLDILDRCLTRNIFKRKILINKIAMTASTWKKADNDALFEKVYSMFSLLDSYFKKESASIILTTLCPYVSVSNQNKLLHYFLQSGYKNNRKRAYTHLQTSWSPEYQGIIEKTWQTYNDEEIINLLVAKMPKDFLLKNFDEISSHFEEKDIDYNFYLKILRNKFYARIVDDISSELKKLKNKDPISFIFIMKDCGKKIDPSWAMEIYKKIPQSRKYLPRWYADMGLWKDILKKNLNIFRD